MGCFKPVRFQKPDRFESLKNIVINKRLQDVKNTNQIQRQSAISQHFLKNPPTPYLYQIHDAGREIHDAGRESLNVDAKQAFW